MYRDIVAFKPDLVIILSSSARGPRVGSSEAVGTSGARAPGVHQGYRLAYEFAAAARRVEPRWRAMIDGGQAQAAPGSLEALVAQEMQRPVLIVELQRGSEQTVNARAALKGVEAVVA